MPTYSTLRRLSVLALSGLLVAATSSLGSPGTHGTQTQDASGSLELTRWSQMVWDSALADDLKQVEQLLDSAPQGKSDAAQALAKAVDARRSHKAQSETDRLKAMEERNKDLAKALAAGNITSALVDAVNLKFLMTQDAWKVWLAGAQGQAVEKMANELAKTAADSGDLLFAQEILFRQKALHDGIDTDVFKKLDSKLDDLNRKVTLIAEYAPRELHRLRKLQAQRLEEIVKTMGTELSKEERGEDRLQDEPFPEFNELFANDWKERLDGITQRIVLQGLRQAASEHVTAAGWKPLMLGGLQAVELVLDTPQLGENFPGLKDPEKVQALRGTVERVRGVVGGMPAEKVGPSAFRATMSEILAANDATVGIPSEVLLREFGEGATTQLSKDYEDDYSEIIWPDNLRRFKQSIEGNFVGVGILIRHNDKRELMIVNPLEGSPASRAGIRPGDKVLAVDDQSTVGWTLNRAVDNITGPVGKQVKLSVKRTGVEDPLDFSLRRASIKMRSVNGWWKEGFDSKGVPQWNWWIDPAAGIGYVRLTSFNEDSLDDFMVAIRQMKKERSLNGLILDLRGNPGGLLKSAVGFVNLFVEEGPVVTVQDRDGNTTGGFSAEKARATLAGLPLVVLVNGNSASASEIVSGSLQVHGAAVIVGDRSFGKGSVQTVQPIQDGPNEAAVKVTTQYYVLPPLPGQEKGRLVHRRASSEIWGVNPDLVVAMTPPQMEQSSELRLALDLLDESAQDSVHVDLRPDPAELLVKGVDPQLETALLILEARIVGEAERQHLAAAGKATAEKVRPQ